MTNNAAAKNSSGKTKIYLASSSPRRRELLQQMDIDFEIIVPDIDESRHDNESPVDYVRRIAKKKVKAVCRELLNKEKSLRYPVLGADTIVVLPQFAASESEQDGLVHHRSGQTDFYQIMGKPEDNNHAFAMLKQLSGRTHEVYSSIALAVPGRDVSGHDVSGENNQSTEKFKVVAKTSQTKVRFAKLSDAQIDAYIATGEPAGKAGGYAIQGRAAAFVEQIHGSYSGVVGLPLYELSELLKQEINGHE